MSMVVPNTSDAHPRSPYRAVKGVRPQTFELRQIVFREGYPGDHVYGITSDVVKIARRGRGTHVRTIALAGPGDIVAELAVVDPGPGANSVVTVGSVTAG